MQPGSPFGGHDERVAQELRLQQRDYLEEAEAAVAETEAARTTLEDRLLQLGSRSVDVGIDVGATQFRGQVVHASAEIVTIRSSSDEEFAVVVTHIDAVRFGASLGPPTVVAPGYPQTLLARLRELWTLEQRCTIGRVGSLSLVGTLVAVTEGHAELRDPKGGNWLLPLRTIAWVATA